MNRITKLCWLILFLTGVFLGALAEGQSVYAGACPTTVGECWTGTPTQVEPWGTCGGTEISWCDTAMGYGLQYGVTFYNGDCAEHYGTWYHSYCCKVASCAGGEDDTCNCGGQECASGCVCCPTGCKRGTDCATATDDSTCIVRTCGTSGNPADCSDLKVAGIGYGYGSVTLHKDEVYSLSAYYSNNKGAHGMGVIRGLRTADSACEKVFNALDPWNYCPVVDDCDPVVTKGSGISSFEWKPDSIGTFTVFCSSSSYKMWACSGFSVGNNTPCDLYDNGSCTQPGSSMTVYVVEPPPSTGTVQGRKVIMPGNQEVEPAVSQTVLLDNQTRIAIAAYGTPVSGVYPSMDLRINGTTIKTWSVTGSSAVYETYVNGTVDPATVSVWFTNDAYALPEDRNLRVDLIKIGSVAYQSESEFVTRTGCGSGDWLWCNGNFQYSSADGAIDSANSSPYYLTDISAGIHSVSVTTPADYSVVSTLCYGRIGCHTDACAAGKPLCPETDSRGCADDCGGAAVSQSGASRTVDVPAGGLADLWWHYLPPPNCWNLSGPPILELGDTGTYGAYFNSPLGNLGGEIFYDNYHSIVNQSCLGNSCALSGDWTPPAVGAYTVYCRSWNDAIAECRPPSLVDGPPRYDCVGPGYQKTVNVIKTGPWWQADSGNVHADNGTVISNIPDTATEPYLITGTKGLLSYHGGVSPTYGDRINEEDNSEWLAETKYQGLKTGYGYFEGILHDDPQPWEDWLGGKPADSGVYSATGPINTSGVWDITTENIVILVNGDVTITDNIYVDPGGFLAIIASGNIIIDSGVTELQGVYIADKVIDTRASTYQLQAEGIFVGWDKDNDGEGIKLQRSLTDNSLLPAEKFTYRPDLVRNAYRYLLKPRIDWQEVAP